jgi:pyruvate formate lyase activating enzyme
VKETLEYLVRETGVWVEITTLLIPGRNDSDAELDAMTAWVADRLGPHVPLHFTAFHPDHRLIDRPPTPPATLRRARAIGLRNGLRYVYVGNVHDPEADSTSCHACGATVIGRDWFRLTGWGLDARGRCAACGEPCAGAFEPAPGTWGPTRRPVDLTAFAAREG